MNRLALPLVLLIACGRPADTPPAADAGGPSPPAGVVDSRESQQQGAAPDNDPESVLRAYFAALGEGRYRDALPFYGGPYDVLRGWNPDHPPEDSAGLWALACRHNGLVCMSRAEILALRQHGDTMSADVQFLTADGTVFVQGPCCGETGATSPPVSRFTYRLVLRDGRYRVLDLPVYVP
jgi:hypothetical protein